MSRRKICWVNEAYSGGVGLLIGGVAMLVLSRKEGDDILLPELDIVVRVLKIRGKAVSIGIDAPRGIRIIRSELESQAYAEKEATWDRELVHAGGYPFFR
jgi:carbon storage regulator CsrA